VVSDTIGRMEVPNAERVRALRDASERAVETIELGHDPEELWPYLTNSDMLNLRARTGPLALRFEPRDEGAALVLASGRVGAVDFELVERPHTFVAPRFVDVDRPFTRGPLLYVGYALELSPRPSGGTSARVEFRWSAAEDVPVRSLFESRLARYVAEFRQIDEELAEEGADASFAPFLEHASAHARAIAELEARFGRLTKDPKAARALAEFVMLAPDAYVRRIRPLEVASHYGAAPLEVLALALRAVKDGLFDMRWDVLCPSCRGSDTGPSHLVDIAARMHCQGCSIEYGASFDENVEVAFYPVPKVRTFESVSFCAGPPSNLPHVGAQFVVDAGERRECRLDLPPGEYAMRDELAGLGASTPLTIDTSGERAASVRLGERREKGARLVLAPGAELVVENPAGSFHALRVDRLAHRDKAATAAMVTSLQIFRDLFSSEVLRPGMSLGVSNVTILFSDLKDSTVLYETRGDAPAFALVQDHFEIMTEVIARSAGGVVKTIGDAVMAVFARPGAAVRAALEILDAFRQWNATHPPEQAIVIKLGLHSGPCLAMTMNDKLDYFGSTVNKAARVQGQSTGDDVALSRELFEDPEVAAELAKAGRLEITPFHAELKGIAGSAELVRVRLATS
jgi:adenylate cyclase